MTNSQVYGGSSVMEAGQFRVNEVNFDVTNKGRKLAQQHFMSIHEVFGDRRVVTKFTSLTWNLLGSTSFCTSHIICLTLPT